MVGVFAQGGVSVQTQEHFQAGVFLDSLNEDGPRPLEQLHHTERRCAPDTRRVLRSTCQPALVRVSRALTGSSQHSRGHTHTPSSPAEGAVPAQPLAEPGHSPQSVT